MRTRLRSSLRFALPFTLLACTGGDERVLESAGLVDADVPAAARAQQSAAGVAATPVAGGASSAAPVTSRPANRLGKVPILEYHIIGDADTRWGRSRASFRRDLEKLYAAGYRPVTAAELVDRKLDHLPAGTSPVVFTFDDASPGQFSYVERNGKLEVDPASAVGIWLDFNRTHPDWGKKAVFCMLPAATHGHAFFGDKGIKGQKTEWRFQKLRFLVEQGFELCNHTLWHAQLSKYSDAQVQEQIARGVMAIDSAVPGYRVRTFALPLGLWPKNRALAEKGSWKDPKTGRVVSYDFDAILEVSGGPTRSPFAPNFTPLSLNRVQVYGNELERTLKELEKTGYVSGGRMASR